MTAMGQMLLALSVFLTAAALLLVGLMDLGRYLVAPATKDGRRKGAGRGPHPARLVLWCASLTILLCLLYAAFIEPRRLRVVPLDIGSRKLPRGAAISAVQVSDLHLGKGGLVREDLARVVNSLGPDLVLLTGDYVNDARGNPPLREFLCALKPRFGMAAVTGTSRWDRFIDPAVFPACGVRLLDYEKASFDVRGAAVDVIGFPVDFDAKTFERLRDPGRFTFLLVHTPDFVEEVPPGSADLYLAGHTHGGQVAVPFFGALITFSRFWKKYEAGPYTVGGNRLFVSRGIGMEGGIPPLRFLAVPEITLVRVAGGGESK